MGNADSIPVVSQTKSLVQVTFGDAEGARRTQENFSRQCPVVSQVRSTVEAVTGDLKGARETQIQFIKGVGDFADSLPGVGHVTIHYVVGDKKGGDRAMKAASRTTGVVAGGAVGFVVGGPVGAVVGGVAGGAAVDGLTTGIDSAVHREYRPAGHVANVTDLVKNPKDPGKWIDTVTTPVFDGLAGYGAGKGGVVRAKGTGKFQTAKLAGKTGVDALKKQVKESPKSAVKPSKTNLTKATVDGLKQGIKAYEDSNERRREILIAALIEAVYASRDELDRLDDEELIEIALIVLQNY